MEVFLNRREISHLDVRRITLGRKKKKKKNHSGSLMAVEWAHVFISTAV